ncbi:MAG: hypothetical protein K8H86_11635, partial [Ignavibacteriaceae bacterium]|nr:hypothetical protein [Ignavibacteriaceae bacterium]
MFPKLSDDVLLAFDSYGANDQIKLIPYQINMPVDYIAHYSEAIYSIWQANDTSLSEVKAALIYNSILATRNSQTNEIVTKPFAERGNIITGPGYRQRVKYSSDQILINYKSTFNLMIKSNPEHQNPPISTEGLDDDLCILKVVVKEIDFDEGTRRFYFKDSLDWFVDTIK